MGVNLVHIRLMMIMEMSRFHELLISYLVSRCSVGGSGFDRVRHARTGGDCARAFDCAGVCKSPSAALLSP